MNGRKNLHIAQSGILVSMMLVLGFIERSLPMPTMIPGIKIGLSNSVLLYSIYTLGVKRSYLLMLLKVLLSGLLFGGVQAMLYSFCGGLLSMIVMTLLYRVPGVSILGVSVAGAVSHCIGQVLAAMLVLRTVQLLYYAGVLSLVSIVTGILTGVAANGVLRVYGKRVP